LSKKSEIRDSLPKSVLSASSQISVGPPPLEPRGGVRKKAKLISSFDRVRGKDRDRTKSRVRTEYRSSRDPRDSRSSRDSYSRDRRDRDREDRSDRNNRDRQRDYRDPKRSPKTSTSYQPPSRPATKLPPQRPPSTIPVPTTRNDPRKKLDPRKVDPRQMDPRKLDPRLDPRKLDPRQMDPRKRDPRQIDPRSLDPRKSVVPPPPPPKSYHPPTSIGFAPPAAGPIIVNQPITRFSMPPPPPGQGAGKPIWEGSMCKSPACDSFNIYMKLLAGEENITKLALPNDADLKLKGRIKFETLAQYIPQMKKSMRKKIFLVEVHPGPGNGSTVCYNKFVQHYRQLRRGAVIDLEKSHGVTMYIMPVIEDLKRETIKAINENFNGAFPPKGVMWGVVVQFPDVLAALKGDIIERHVRAQPSAKEIKSRVVTQNSDPRAADPRAGPVQKAVDDDVMDALRKLQEMG